jgi:hypothetical protein
MTRRLKLEKDGILRDREGLAVGKLVSITLELFEDVERGGEGGSVVVGEEQQQLEVGASAGGRAGASNSGDSAPKVDPVPEVWATYVQHHKPRNTDLDLGGRAVIRDALKVANLDELKRAIIACASSDFHMGKNDRNRKYNRLSQILKGKRGLKTTREQIDMFLDMETGSGLQSQVPSGSTERINSLKRTVIDAYDFPGDDPLQERNIVARQRLTDMGWTIGQDMDRLNSVGQGFPTFLPPAAAA